MTGPHAERDRAAASSEPAAPRSPWLMLAGAAMVLQVVVLYWPHAPGAPAGLSADKLVHVLVFAVPALTALLAGLRVGWVVPTLALHAPVSELVQAMLLPGRNGDLRDMLADVTGVALGALAFVVWRRPRDC